MRKLITLFVAVCMAVGANAVTVVDYEKYFTDGTYATWHSEATDISSRFKIDTKRVYRIIGKRYAETMLEIHKSQTGINSIFADKKQGSGKWFDLSGRNVGNDFKGLVIPLSQLLLCSFLCEFLVAEYGYE